jgi:hypothetical protein
MLPVVINEPDGFSRFPGLRAFVRASDGFKWQQKTGEQEQAFRDRVLKEAAHDGVALPGEATIRVLAVRPRLSLEQWRTLHGIDAGNNQKESSHESC